MKYSARLHPLATGSLLLAAMATAGCQATRTKVTSLNPLKAINDKDVVQGVPDRVVGTWSEAVLHEDGQGTRGFGGRLFFYNRQTEAPIRVDGQLVVYAFAESDRAEGDNRPTKRYVFPVEQFKKHETMSELGVSYSVWLPWDAAGGEQAEVSLIARFEPSQGGGLVVSEQARQRLPGKPRKETMLADKPVESRVERASFTSSVEVRDIKPAATPAKPQLTATTISLPGRFKNSTPAPRAAAAPTAASEQQAAELLDAAVAAQATPIGTAVEYLTPGESVRRSVQPRSFD